MAAWTSMWQPVAPALLVAGLTVAPVGLDLQQGPWGGASQAYARGSSAGGPGGGGPGDSRGGGVGGRGGAEQGAASAAGHDARESGGGPGDRGSEDFNGRGVFEGVGRATAHEQDLAVARERHNRALGAPAHITAKASAGPGQEFDTDTAVFVFGEPATEALIRAGWVAPQLRSDRALAEHGQKVAVHVAIATALGHPAYVGVLLATFGSNGPGHRPAGDWEDVTLDLNGDGIVDGHDLKSAVQRQVAR